MREEGRLTKEEKCMRDIVSKPQARATKGQLDVPVGTRSDLSTPILFSRDT